MQSVKDAQTALLIALETVQDEEIPLRKANDRVLAQPIIAQRDSPPFTNSSMDGFAVRAEDLATLKKGGGIQLKVVDDIPAGHSPDKSLVNGQAMRIMTGAQLPKGADAVVPVEDTDIEHRDADALLPKKVRVMRFKGRASYVRPKGQDYQSGETLLEPGKRLRSQDLALLALNGNAVVRVFRQPRVALLSSGDELVELGGELPEGKIYESNSYSLAAQVESCGAQVLNLGIAPDELKQITRKLDEAVQERADLILSSAGVSVGAYDYLRDAVLASGELEFWRVNMRPGKPLAFGKYSGIPFIGVPGNPVSSFASFEVFGRPALNSMAGVKDWQRFTFESVLDEDIQAKSRESYLRAYYKRKNGASTVSLTGHQGSGNLYSLVQANCLIVIPAGKSLVKAGSKVETWPL